MGERALIRRKKASQPLFLHSRGGGGVGLLLLNSNSYFDFQGIPQNCSTVLCDLIISRTYNRAVRSNNSFALVVPTIKLKHYGERSFSYTAPVEWNKLDVEIRSLSNLETFKKKSKTYLFNIAFT